MESNFKDDVNLVQNAVAQIEVDYQSNDFLESATQ